MNNDDYDLTVAETVELARTVETIELTGLQLTIIANSLAAAVNNPELLPANLQNSVGYIQECSKAYDYVSSYAERILRIYEARKIQENQASTNDRKSIDEKAS